MPSVIYNPPILHPTSYIKMPSDSNPTLFQRIRRLFSLRTILSLVWLIAIIVLIWYRREQALSSLASLSGLPLGYFEPLEVPWWYQSVGADQLAFITVFAMWLFFLPFGRVPVMRGILFSLGMVLLIVILNWLIYRTDQPLLIILALICFFLLYITQVPRAAALLLTLCIVLFIAIPHWFQYSNPPRVSAKEFDVAKRQAVLRMSQEEWADNNYLQPYDCEPYDATDPPLNSNLLHISRTLHVNIVRCESSSWKEPGAILIWKDMFGTHTTFIFGAPWKVFQEYYMTLGIPSSQPYMAPNNRIAQDFGVTMRIMYEPKKDKNQPGVAWIQQRYLLSFLPNIFCFEILHTPTNRSCWRPTEAEGKSVFYSEQSIPTAYPEDWLEDADYDIPLGGWWAPLNTWKALFMAEAMCFIFILLLPFRQSLVTMWIQFACMGKLVFFLFILGLAISMIVLAFSSLYSNPNNILNNLVFFQPPDLNLKEGFNPLNPMQQFSKFMVSWFDNRSLFTLQETTLPWREIVRLWIFRGLWIATGLSLGLLLMPLWVGLAIGGPMGGWIGLFVLFGMMMALGSFAPLKSFGSFAGQWLEG